MSVLEEVTKLLAKNPLVLAAAAVGGAGIVNVVDSAIAEQLRISWPLVPDWLRPVFDLVRGLWRPFVDALLRFLPFELSGPAKDYLMMGCIAAGMRLRSSRVIWKALKTDALTEYPQRVVLGEPMILRKGERSKYYFVFLPARLSFAFFVWPAKIFGAAWRYTSGDWSAGFPEGPQRKVRQEQYVTFFGAVFWAGFFFLVCLLVR